MVSSPNNGESAGLLVSVRQRLASLRDRLVAQPNLIAPMRDDMIEELQIVLNLLQESQAAISAERNTLKSEQSTGVLEIERLRNSLQEREVLLREIHHRVKNNLQIVSSLLDLQMIRTRDSTVQALLRSNQSRISAIALVHDQLYQAEDLALVLLGDYVQSLATILVRTYALEPRQVVLQTSVNTDLLLSPNYVIPLGLILNELISNALKHGLRDRAGEIRVDLEARHQTLTLSVSNTGEPLPIEFDQNSPQSLGFQLLNSLVQQIDGSMSIERLQPDFRAQSGSVDLEAISEAADRTLQTRVTVQFSVPDSE